jgi:hypothetical protein
LELVVIFSSFAPAGASRRDEPANLAANRAGKRDFPSVDMSEDLVPDFAMTIRTTDEDGAVENSFHILEVDLVIA